MANLRKLVLSLLGVIATFTIPLEGRAAWTLSNTNGGDGFITGSFPSFTLAGSDNGGATDLENTVYYVQTFASATVVSFNWIYTTYDCCGAHWDPAGYVLNGSTTPLSPDIEGNPGDGNSSGSSSISVASGDTFGWYVYSPDSIEGRATLQISPVPEPNSLILFALGTAGLLAVARRRKSDR